MCNFRNLLFVIFTQIRSISSSFVSCFFAKIHSTIQFSVNNKISSLQNLLLYRRRIHQFRIGFYGSNVGKQTQFFSKFKQTLFGTHFCSGIIIIFWVSNGSKQNRIRVSTQIQSLVWKWFPHFFNGDGANVGIFKNKLVIINHADSVQCFFGLQSYLWTYSISRKYCYF